MKTFSQWLICFEIISGTNERVIKSTLFDNVSLGAQTPHVPTHVWQLHVPNAELGELKHYKEAI